MKFLQSRFDDYIIETEKNNLHPELEGTTVIKSEDIKTRCNIIFYGPSGTGKYTQALRYIKNYSDSDLKYERKITLNFQNKRDFVIKLSDTHFEIDMELLGCNAKLLWNSIYNNILDILATRPNHTGIILCKNFHKIHSELLDIFYSYLQTLSHKNLTIYYIFLTENISFIPNNISNRCQIIPVKTPLKNSYKKCMGQIIDKSIKLEHIFNIKDLTLKNTQLLEPNKKIVGEIIKNINDYKNINFLQFRDLLYNIFIYHLDVNTCILQILTHFIKNKKINDKNVSAIFFEFYNFLKYYNNNYRPIYHLEKFMFYLCKIIHGL